MKKINNFILNRNFKFNKLGNEFIVVNDSEEIFGVQGCAALIIEIIDANQESNLDQIFEKLSKNYFFEEELVFEAIDLLKNNYVIKEQ